MKSLCSGRIWAVAVLGIWPISGLMAVATQWEGDVDGNWGTSGNWSAGIPVLGNDATFYAPGAGHLNIAFVGSRLARSLQFSDDADADVSISGNGILDLGDGGIVIGGGALGQHGLKTTQNTAGLRLNRTGGATVFTNSSSKTFTIDAILSAVTGAGSLVFDGPGNFDWIFSSTTTGGSVKSSMSSITLSGSYSGTVSFGRGSDNMNIAAGTWTINGGVFALNGATTQVPVFTVNSGATFTGTGIKNSPNTNNAGALTINGGGTLDPGSVGGVGVLTACRTPVAFNAGSRFRVDLLNSVSHDKLVLSTGTSGTAVLSLASGTGVALDINFLPGFTASVGDVFRIVQDYQLLSGSFAGLPNGGSVVRNGYTFQIDYLTGNDITLTVTSLPSSKQIEIFFNVPDGLTAYTGTQPFLFGVPFPEGELPAGHGVQLVDQTGQEVPGQFEVTATWRPDGANVRWLLVDGLVQITNGQAQRVFLKYGPSVAAQNTQSAFAITNTPGQVTVNTGARTFVFNRSGGNSGQAVLKTPPGTAYTTGDSNDSDWTVEVEKNGPVRCVVKITGCYKTAAGALVGQHVTRYRLYANSRMARVFHTLIWQTADPYKVTSYDFKVPLAVSPGNTVSLGVDGQVAQALPSEDMQLRQFQPSVVTGVQSGTRSEGWVGATAASESGFLALRWPWQQCPVGIGATPTALRIGLVCPQSDISWRPQDQILPQLANRTTRWDNLLVYDSTKDPKHDTVVSGADALPYMTARGLSKTWEMLLWYDAAAPAVPAQTKNIFAQHPILAYADPAFATRAGLPSPMSPRSPASYPAVEAAIEHSFDWYTREKEAEGDFGLFNYGDIQWSFTETGTPVYRYWMNNGKGWSVLPWVLWLRSGDRKYMEKGEANSRQCMDMDMSHVLNWDMDPTDYQMRGAQFCYSSVNHGAGPSLYRFLVDSEYLPYAYYMTGYERGKDCLLMHAEAVARFSYLEMLTSHYLEKKTYASRSLYTMVGNLCALYEATWDSRLLSTATTWLDLLKEAQNSMGNLPGDKTNHYVDQPLNIAARTLGWPEVETALKAWHDFHGDPLQPSAISGDMGGPQSLWSAVSLYQHGFGTRYLDVAAAVMNTQAATVAQTSNEWDGMSSMPAHIAGPAIRDWTVVMSALDALPASQRPGGYIPVQGFSAKLPLDSAKTTAGYTCREVAYVRNTTGQNFQIELSFAKDTNGYLIQVLAPNGTVVLNEIGAPYPTNTSTYYLDDRAKIVYQVPAQNQTGAFAVQIWSKGATQYWVAYALKSSTGKVVYLMPEGSAHFFANAYAGQFWFRPAGEQNVLFSNLKGTRLVGLNRMLSASGGSLATNGITGSVAYNPSNAVSTYTATLPTGQSCQRFASFSESLQLQSMVVASGPIESWYWNIDGMKPYLSATAEEWFDPEAYLHVPWTVFLTPQ